MSRRDRKTRRCFRCNKTLRLDWSEIRVLFSSNSAREAVEAVKRLKIEQAKSDSPILSIGFSSPEENR